MVLQDRNLTLCLHKKKDKDLHRVLLRKIKENDAKIFTKLLTDPKVMEFSEGIRTQDEIGGWVSKIIDQYSRESGYGTFAIELIETESIIGYCSLIKSKYTDLPEVGYRLLPEYWKKGLATEAVKLIIAIGFRDIGLKDIYAQVDPNNLASVKLLHRLGMAFDHEIKPEGYDYADQIWVINKDMFNEMNNET